MVRSFARALILLSGLICAGGPAAAQDQLRFVMVTHGAAADPFWAAIKEGADRAAADAGVTVTYRAPDTFDLDAMATLVTSAVAEKPAGLIVSIPNGDALAAPIRAAVDAGIPVISINSGFDISKSLGALLHVGQSEYEAGRTAGERLRELGGRKALCLNHELGNVALDLRCKGFIDGFGGSVEVLPLDPDAASASAAVAEKLAADDGIDVILALSASLAGQPAVAAVKALEDGRKVRVASFDVTDELLAAVADGSAAFILDQQPFLQGYLPVQYLTLLSRHNVVPVSNVSTGPKLVDAREAARRLGRPGEIPATPAAADAAPAEQGGG